MTVSFDSNVFIYAFHHSDERQPAARLIVDRLAQRCGLLAEQVIREFLAVPQRRGFVPPAKARPVVESICDRLEIVQGTTEDLLAASKLAERHKLQYYDALLCCTVRRAGCQFLLSHDMQDGFMIGTMRVVDPFAPPNAGLLAELLA